MTAGRNNLQITDQELSEALLKLYDNMADYNDCSGFLYDAVAALVAQEEALDERTLEGIRHMTRWMKGKTEALKEELRALRERAFGASYH